MKVPLFDNPPPPPERQHNIMQDIDKILDKHLPDAGLCQRGKILNKQRKERLKADLLLLLANDKDALLIVDETQLGLIEGGKPEPIRERPTTDTTTWERHG